MKNLSTYQKVVMGSLLLILAFAGWAVFQKLTKPTPYNSTVLQQVLERQQSIDSLLRRTYALTNRRNKIISRRDTMVLKITEHVTNKYKDYEREIDNAIDAKLPVVIDSLHARYKQRRSKESK